MPVQVSSSTFTVNTFALLDDGSTVTLIHKDLSRKLNIHGQHINIGLKGITDKEAISTSCEKVIFNISGEQNTFIIKNGLAAPKLFLPCQTLSKELVRFIAKNENIFIQPYTNVRPQILIGQDNWRILVARETHGIGNTSVAVSHSGLGWVAHGVAGREKCTIFSNTCLWQDGEIIGLDELVKNYFQINSLGI